MNIGDDRIIWVCECGLERDIVGSKVEAKKHRKRICPYCCQLKDHKVVTLTVTEVE